MKALIAARSGSQRVKNKNIRPFGNTTLLELKIEQLLRIEKINGIVVNSNDPEILSIASNYGCELIKRDSAYATNDVCMSDVYKNMAENFTDELILYANCTNPLLSDDSITNAIEEYLKINGEYDSLNSAHLVKEFLFKDNKPINYSLREQPRSQDLPDYYALNFAINIIAREKMIEYKNVVGYKPLIYGIDEVEGYDIDNPIDFDFCEYMYQRSKKQFAKFPES